LKDLVLGQEKINENLTKKLTFNDKMLENIKLSPQVKLSHEKWWQGP
jgi:hypothetical protein